MEFCRKQHFLELDILLQKIEPNIDKRRFKIKNILEYAYRMQHNDAEKSFFVPASESLWRRFYKCPKKFLHNPEYIVNASVVYVPKIRVLARDTVNLQLKDGNFKQMRQSLEDERNLQETLFQIINFLGDTMPLEATSFRGFLARTAEVLKKGERSPADEEKIVALIVKYFRLETLGSSKNSFGFYFREICNITGLNEDKNFLIQAGSKKKNFIVPNKFIYIDDNKAVFVMYGMVVHKSEPHSEYQFLRMKYDSRSLGKLNSLQSAREIIGKKIFSISKGTSEIASSKAVATIKFIIYNRVNINVGEVIIGLCCSGYLPQNFEANSQQIKKPEHFVLETLDPRKDEWKALSRLSGIDDGQQLKDFFTKKIKDVVLRFYLATNGALGEMLRKFIKKFETEQILFANRRDPILRYMMQKKQHIVINAPKAPPKFDELAEVPKQKQQFSDAQKASLRNAGVDDTTISYIENSIYMFWPIIYIFFIILENYFPELKGKRLSLTTITTLVCTLLVKIYSKIESGKSFTDLIFDLVKEFIPDSVWQRIALGAFGAAGLFYLARTNSAAVLEWFNSMVAYLKGTTFTYEHWKQTGDDLFKIVECTGQDQASDSDIAIPANIVSSKDPPKSETVSETAPDKDDGKNPGKPAAPGSAPVAGVIGDVPVAAEPSGPVSGVVPAAPGVVPDGEVPITAPVPVTVSESVPAPVPAPAATTLDAVPAPAVVISDLTKEEEEKLEEDDKLLKAVKKEKNEDPIKYLESTEIIEARKARQANALSKKKIQADEEAAEIKNQKQINKAKKEAQIFLNNKPDEIMNNLAKKEYREHKERIRQVEAAKKEVESKKAKETAKEKEAKSNFLKKIYKEILKKKEIDEFDKILENAKASEEKRTKKEAESKNKVKAEAAKAEEQQNQRKINENYTKLNQSQKLGQKLNTELINRIKAEKIAEARKVQDFEKFLKTRKLTQDKAAEEKLKKDNAAEKLKKAEEEEATRQAAEQARKKQDFENFLESARKEAEKKNEKNFTEFRNNLEANKKAKEANKEAENLKDFEEILENAKKEEAAEKKNYLEKALKEEESENKKQFTEFKNKLELQSLKNAAEESSRQENETKIEKAAKKKAEADAKEKQLKDFKSSKIITAAKKTELKKFSKLNPKNLKLSDKAKKKLKDFLDTGTPEQKLIYFKKLDRYSSSDNYLSRLVDISQGKVFDIFEPGTWELTDFYDYTEPTKLENYEIKLLKKEGITPKDVAETSKKINQIFTKLRIKLSKENIDPYYQKLEEKVTDKGFELKKFIKEFDELIEKDVAAKEAADLAKDVAAKKADLAKEAEAKNAAPEAPQEEAQKEVVNEETEVKSQLETLIPENLKLSPKVIKKLNDFLKNGTEEQQLIFFKRLKGWNSSQDKLSRLVDISQGKPSLLDLFYLGKLDEFSEFSPTVKDYLQSINIENWEKKKLENGSIKPKDLAEKSEIVNNILNDLNDEDKTDYLIKLNAENYDDPVKYLNSLIEKNNNDRTELLRKNYIQNNLVIGPKIIEKIKDFLDKGTPEQQLKYFKSLDEWSSSENDLNRLVDISLDNPSLRDLFQTINIEKWEKNVLNEKNAKNVADTSKEINHMLNPFSEIEKNKFKNTLNEKNFFKEKDYKDYLENLIEEINDYKKDGFLPEKWNFNENLLNKLNDLKTENEKNIYLQFYNNFKESPESLKNLVDIAKNSKWNTYNNEDIKNLKFDEIIEIKDISAEIRDNINKKISFNNYKNDGLIPETWDYSESLLNKLNELDTPNKKNIYLDFLQKENWNKSPETISRLVDISTNNIWKTWELSDIYDQYHYGSIEKKTSTETVAKKILNNHFDFSEQKETNENLQENFNRKRNDKTLTYEQQVNYLIDTKKGVDKLKEDISEKLPVQEKNIYENKKLQISENNDYKKNNNAIIPETYEKIRDEEKQKKVKENPKKILRQKRNSSKAIRQAAADKAATDKALRQAAEKASDKAAEEILRQEAEDKAAEKLESEILSSKEKEAAAKEILRQKAEEILRQEAEEKLKQEEAEKEKELIQQEKININQKKDYKKLLKDKFKEFKNAEKSENKILIEKLEKELKIIIEEAQKDLESDFSYLNAFFTYVQDLGSGLVTTVTNEAMAFGKDAIKRVVEKAADYAAYAAYAAFYNFINNQNTPIVPPSGNTAIVTAAVTAAVSAIGTTIRTGISDLFLRPFEWNSNDWSPETAAHRSAAPPAPTAPAAPPTRQEPSATASLHNLRPRGNLRARARLIEEMEVDTQELIPQDLNPIRLALEALLCFMIWFGSKKCDSIKGFLITVLVAILLLFALMAITMGIVTGRNCGVGGKDLLQRIVYYAFVSIGYYFTDLFSGGAGDIFAKFATKTATFGALYFLFESVTAVSEKKKPLKEEAKKLLENLKKDKK
jgi:hypothetical protein